MGLSCISITPERELSVDFSHSFYETHLAIAVRNQGLWESLKRIATNPDLLKLLGLISTNITGPNDLARVSVAVKSMSTAQALGRYLGELP